MPYAGLPKIGLVLHNKLLGLKQVEDGGRSVSGGSACTNPIQPIDKQLDRFNCPASLYL